MWVRSSFPTSMDDLVNVFLEKLQKINIHYFTPLGLRFECHSSMWLQITGYFVNIMYLFCRKTFLHICASLICKVVTSLSKCNTQIHMTNKHAHILAIIHKIYLEKPLNLTAMLCDSKGEATVSPGMAGLHRFIGGVEGVEGVPP